MTCGSYTKFLSLLMFNRVVNQQTLALICGDQKLAYYYKSRALKLGHIRQSRIERRERTKHVITLYFLTKSGFTYLLEHDKDINYLFPSDDCASLRTIKKDDYKIGRKMKLARDSETLALAASAGAAIPYENFTIGLRTLHKIEDVNEEDLSIEDYLESNLTEDVYQSLRLYRNVSLNNAAILFYNGTVVKAIAGKANDHVSVRDYLSGRYSGIAESHLKSVLIYATPLFGMGWSKWLVEKEISAQVIWKKTRSIVQEAYRFSKGASAALIVNSPQQFANLYRDVDQAKRSEGEVFGGGFTNLYILPLNNEGAKHLQWLMLTDDDAFSAATIMEALKSGVYVRSDKANAGLFPLLNVNGFRTALGFQLNAKLALRIEQIANTLPDEHFEILCQKWQVPYYQAIMPANVEIVSVELE